MSRHLQTAPLHRHGVDRACHEASAQIRPNAALLCESWLRHGGPAHIAGPPRADAAQPAGTTIFPCARRIPRETKSPCPPVVHSRSRPGGCAAPDLRLIGITRDAMGADLKLQEIHHG